jgi:hypothetical protein
MTDYGGTHKAGVMGRLGGQHPLPGMPILETKIRATVIRLLESNRELQISGRP